MILILIMIMMIMIVMIMKSNDVILIDDINDDNNVKWND